MYSQSNKPKKRKTKKISFLPPIDPNQRYTIPEGNALLRQSNAKTYQDIRAGELKIIKDRYRTYIPGTEIIRRSTLAAS